MSQNLLAEAQWLRDNPHFSERPASIREFMGPDYLDLVDTIRPGILEVLVDIFGEEVDPHWISTKRKAALTGSIGFGKSFAASIILVYFVHWVQCLKDPQGFFGLAPGTRIAFMMMSTSERQAREVLFGDVKARVNHSPWFRRFCKFDPQFKNQLRFPRDIWIVPGGSEETRFEGYNVLCKDELTEIFTRQGWKRYDQLTVGEDILTLNHETGVAEWNPVQRVNVFDSPGELVLMEGSEFSSLSTDGHRWATTTRWGARRWRTTATLNGEDRIPLAAVGGAAPVATHSDALVEAVSWFYTEGSRVGHSGAVIYQKNGTESCDRIRACLTALFGPPVEKFQTTSSASSGPMWRENVNNSTDTRHGGPKGLSEFRMNRDAGAVLLGHAPDRVPSERFLGELTQAQLDLFIATSLLADNRGRDVFAQKNHAQAEAFAFAAILAGHAVSVRTQWQPVKRKDGSVDGYEMLLVRLMKKRNVSPVSAARCKTGPFSITRVPHKGIVWCPTVTNSTWLARRKGSVYFTGNCGVIDEADSHKQTDLKDYAEQGLDTISSRIASRFPDYESGKHRGLIVVIGQMKSATGFMHRIYNEWRKDADASTKRMMLWESLGWHKFTENPKDIAGGRETAPRKSFVYDVERKRIIPTAEARSAGIDFRTPDSGYIEVPTMYLPEFRRDPVKALRDLAGIPPEASDPFIALPDRILACQDHWHARFGDDPRVGDEPTWPKLRIPPARDGIKRVVHLDLAVSGQGDALGLAMGHVAGIVDVDGEEKPLIVFDLLMRIHAPSGGEIILGDVRRIIYRLARDLGYPIKLVTADGFSSVDTLQQMRKAKINADYLSVDKTKQPYEDLREAIYDERVLFPKYLSRIREGDTEPINIAYRELSQISDVGMKIDHPTPGCFVGETRIPTLDGQYPQISELEGKETWVYSCAQDGTVVPGRARGRMTKEVSELVDVILDNGYVARCTPEHPWMLRDGTYKAAAELEPGVDRLMPINFSWPVDGGYTRITHPNGERQSGHRMVAEHMSGRKVRPTEIVHHVNRVKIDNRPENLEIIDESDHKTEHANEFWSGKESAFREGYNTWLSSPRKDEMYARRRNPGWTAGKDLEAQRQVIESRRNFRSDITLEVMATVMRALTANEASRMLGCGRNVIIARLTQGGYKDWDDFKARHGDNHKVRAVIPVHLDRPVPVYDLEVDEWSNFALPGGVFVHNSKDVADAMAGVVHVLMTQIQYRRGALHVAHPAPDREAPLSSQVQAESLGSQGESLAQTIMGGRDAPSAWAGGDPTSSGPSFEDWLARYGQPAQGASGPPVVELPRRTD